MAIQNLSSLYDLVGNFGEADSGPVANMANQTGPSWNITGPGGTAPFVRSNYPFGVPVNSGLHAGPNADQAGRSLVGPSYAYNYDNSADAVGPALLDLDGVIPFATHPLITINPFGNQQLPYNQFGPPDGFY